VELWTNIRGHNGLVIHACSVMLSLFTRYSQMLLLKYEGPVNGLLLLLLLLLKYVSLCKFCSIYIGCQSGMSVTCLVHQSLSGHPPRYLADDINFVANSDQYMTGHAQYLGHTRG